MRNIFLYLVISGLLLTAGCARNSSSNTPASTIDTTAVPVLQKREVVDDTSAKTQGQYAKEPESKYGLNEMERKKLYKEIADAELRATDEAVDGTATDIDTLTKQAARSNELREVYLDQVAKKYGVTRDTLKQIGIEGVLSDWPM